MKSRRPTIVQRVAQQRDGPGDQRDYELDAARQAETDCRDNNGPVGRTTVRALLYLVMPSCGGGRCERHAA
jgi:hypothetical protein